MNSTLKRTFNKRPNSQDAGGKRKPLVPLLLIIVVVIAALLLLPLYPALRFEYGGKPCLVLPLHRNELFSIRYNHSVNRSPVIDTLEWTGDDTMVVRTSLYQTYGAGIPSFVDGVGTGVVKTEDGYLLIGIDSPHETISLITGTYADHHILYRGREIQLKAIVGEKQLLVLRVKRVPLIEIFAFSAS